MYRCAFCHHQLRFYGISQMRQEGWVRWSVCDYCGHYFKDNGQRYIGTQKTEPPKSIFRTT